MTAATERSIVGQELTRILGEARGTRDGKSWLDDDLFRVLGNRTSFAAAPPLPKSKEHRFPSSLTTTTPRPPEVPMCLQQNQTPPPSQSPVQLSQELAEGNCGPHGVIADGDPKSHVGQRRVFPPPTRRLQIQPNTSPLLGWEGKGVLGPQNGDPVGRKANHKHFEEEGAGYPGVERKVSWSAGLEGKCIGVPNHQNKMR